MKFLSFEQAREKMLGQYARVLESYDKQRSEALYQELKTIYDGEEYEVLGKGKALKHFLERVELFVNPADIFADLSANENTPLRIRKEVYASFHKKKGEDKIADKRKQSRHRSSPLSSFISLPSPSDTSSGMSANQRRTTSQSMSVTTG